MSKLSDPRSFRRIAAGAAMVVTPVIALAVELIHPEPSTDAAELVAIATENADRWYLAHALALVALAGSIPVILGLMHLLRGTRPAFGHVGATVGFLGLVPLAGLVGTEFVLWQATAIDSPAIVQLTDRLDESPGIALIVIFATLFPLGWFILGLGLFRARVLPAWQAWLIALGFPIIWIGDLTIVKIVTLVGAAAMVAGLVPLGWRILMQSDEAWEEGLATEAYRPAPAA